MSGRPGKKWTNGFRSGEGIDSFDVRESRTVMEEERVEKQESDSPAFIGDGPYGEGRPDPRY